MSTMTRSELLQELQARRIPEEAYCLDGGLPCEAYVLGFGEGQWQVYYSERGQKTGCRDFATEAEACVCFLERISREVKPRP